jgi:hypothetical protein
MRTQHDGCGVQAERYQQYHGLHYFRGFAALPAACQDDNLRENSDKQGVCTDQMNEMGQNCSVLCFSLDASASGSVLPIPACVLIYAS